MNYLTLVEVADVLSASLNFEAVTAGAIDESLSETVGVYQREGLVPRECVGSFSSYETARLRLVLRWGISPTQAEAKAAKIADIIGAFRNMPTASHRIIFTVIRAVRSMGKDSKGICEYVIDADIIYSERNE